MKLGTRLTAIADMLPARVRGGRIADIGTDHGFLAIYLVEEGLAGSVIATDINKGPLAAAREHIAVRGLGDRIKTRLGDGLSPLDAGEADAVICAGMGGKLMLKILSARRNLLKTIPCMVLSPQSEVAEFRAGIKELGFFVEKERMVLCDGKFYDIILAAAGAETEETPGISADAAYIYGRYLPERPDEAFLKFLQREKQLLWDILGRMDESGVKSKTALDRMQDVKKKLSAAEEVYAYALQRYHRDA